MFVTPLNFKQVLERFYHQDKYDLMLLFVSSFDGNDRTIIHEIVDNAKRIDRITGERICFFYFIKDSYDNMNEKITRWVRDISDWAPLYGEGVSVTMETADDICCHFAVLRSNLPAFILVDKNRREEPQIFSIHDYQDFESFLTPLNILHSYIEDRESILSRYERERSKGVVTKEEVDNRNERRKAWYVALQLLERKRTKELSLGLVERAEKREIEIQEFKRKLEELPNIEEKGIDESIPYPHEELKYIRNTAIEKLNISLNSQEGENVVEDLQSQYRYSDAVLKVWQLVRTRGVRLSRILEHIRYEIHERGFDVFISCKSQDYGLAHELYDFLVLNGFKPFLADSSIKEVGIDQYTALIGEVINVCQYMVVFATDIRYLETPYVAAEWHTFINDINSGHKPNAKIVSILSPEINPHHLPCWLWDKQCFTTENYKYDLIHFFKKENDVETIKRLENIVDTAYSDVIQQFDLFLLSCYYYEDPLGIVQEYINTIEHDKTELNHRLCSMQTRNITCLNRVFEIEKLRAVVFSTLKKWSLCPKGLAKALDDESYWSQVINTLPEYKNHLLHKYLELYPQGLYSKEASKLICDLGNRELNSRSNEETSTRVFSYSPLYCYKIKVPAGIICFDSRVYDVYSSIFAPAEVKSMSHMLVQVYLHLYEETEKVKKLAQESDKNAERRDYIPLQCKLKKGDKVDVLLNLYGETLLMSDKKNVVWQGSFTKCSFDYFVPKDIDVDELSCVALLSVNGVPVGEMRFITKIVDNPRKLNPEIIAHKYNKVFISYSHQDESKVKFLHEGLELGAVPHFFDRKYLKAGDVFPQVIQDYINSADLFILCWSENASKSDYVQKERLQALKRAFPQVQPEKAAKLRIYPMSIEPRAELPSDMKEYYHFGEI